MKKILLDTNAYSSLLRGNEKVLEAVSSAGIIYMSVFVIGELLTGFKGGVKELWNRDTLFSFLEKPTVVVLNATTETSEIFAEVKNLLKIAGTPIPLNDVWIAAHTMETGSLIVTYDFHFKSVAGLRIYP